MCSMNLSAVQFFRNTIISKRRLICLWSFCVAFLSVAYFIDCGGAVLKDQGECCLDRYLKQTIKC
jgi:hypothetical protein